MAFENKYTTSLYGRRFGLQLMSTVEHGGVAPVDFLIGPASLRSGVTTNQTTGVAVPAHGVTFIDGTSAASSSVYVLDPPIPGVKKVLVFSSANTPQYVRTKNAETFRTSADSTIATVLKSTLTGVVVELIGLTTAMWGIMDNGSSAYSRSATT